SVPPVLSQLPNPRLICPEAARIVPLFTTAGDERLPLMLRLPVPALLAIKPLLRTTVNAIDPWPAMLLLFTSGPAPIIVVVPVPLVPSCSVPVPLSVTVVAPTLIVLAPVPF